MTKATHYGNCQWCGSLQKLPGGVLSTHGYTVTHGWFNGICHGSGHLPYQISCGLIEDSIRWAKSQRNNIEAQREMALAVDPATTNKCWQHVYHPELSSRTRGMVRIWEEVELIQTYPDQNRFHHFVHRGKRHDVHNRGLLAEKVDEGQQHYAIHLCAQIGEIDVYIARQEQRVSAWKPADLKPIAAGKPAGSIVDDTFNLRR
jgi:hypothetical protein